MVMIAYLGSAWGDDFIAFAQIVIRVHHSRNKLKTFVNTLKEIASSFSNKIF